MHAILQIISAMIQKNKAKKLLALYDGSDDLVLDAYKDAKRTLDMMEAGYSDAFLKDFFTSLNVKVTVNKINAGIQLNLSVNFVVALKGIEPLISP